jgi:hypothetical protein
MNQPTPSCPTCGGPMFDERKSRYWNNGKTREGKRKPMFKCRDKDNCDGVLWNEQGATTPPAESNGNGHASAAPLPPITWDEMKKQYGECVAAVCHNLVPYVKDKGFTIDGDMIATMTRDLFTERMRRGC